MGKDTFAIPLARCPTEFLSRNWPFWIVAIVAKLILADFVDASLNVAGDLHEDPCSLPVKSDSGSRENLHSRINSPTRCRTAWSRSDAAPNEENDEVSSA